VKTAFDTGMNRTGIATSPIESPKTIQGAEEGASLKDQRGPAALFDARFSYAEQADPIGSVPPPATVKGAVKTAAKAIMGEKATVFIDKLGERCAFERAGVRLYDLVLLKAEAYPTWEGGPSIADLRQIQDDELLHFGLIQQCLTELGADPTAMTPSADLAVNLSKGVPAVLADPRTDLRECLEGILIAELTDNACWENLIALATELGQTEMARRFSTALANEQDHLKRVRSWVAASLELAAKGDLPRPVREPPAATP
jgi:hypothetical protein